MRTGTRREQESSFQSKALELIRKRGGYPIKIQVSACQSQGEPDLVCCYLGKFVAFELKEKGNKTSKLQDLKIKEIQHSGGIAKSVYTLNEIEEVLNEIFRVQHGSESEQ